MTVQFRSRIPSVIDYAAEIKSVGVCCYLGDDGKMTSVESTQIECYTLKGHFQFGDINEISCDEVADTGCCCSCSEASKHENVEEYEAFLDAAANSADANCTSGPAKPAWGDGIGLKSNTTQCQCDKLGGKWTAGDCPTIFNNDVNHKDGVRTRCYVPGTIVPLEYKYYCTGTGSCASCLSTNCPNDVTLYYDDKAECDQYCTDPVRWDCCEGKCYSANDATLPYTTKEQCQAHCPRLICGIENNQRKCITTFNDPKGTNGSFGNILDCLASCIQDVKGTCCLKDSSYGYNDSCRTVTDQTECVDQTGPGHWTPFQYPVLLNYQKTAQYTATYTAGKTMCGPLPGCVVANAKGYCFGYNNTDPTVSANAILTWEWDCYENGGADWGRVLFPNAAPTLKPNWFCIDGTCTQRYTMPGATYPYPTGISYANEAACLLVGCTPESSTPPQCNIATGRCCGTGDGSGSGSVINPTGPTTGTSRMLRGGAWINNSINCRASWRYNYTPDNINFNLGFRVARTAGLASDIWYDVITSDVDPTVVTNATMRDAIIATGLPWKVRDKGTRIEMLLVPAGTFTMGCSASAQYVCNSNENPAHQVTLTNAFYMGKTEVTQAQWTAKMGSNPSYFQGASYPDAANRPVERVSWDMIASGSTSFMSLTGLRLPTEAEWEYAYRAGTTTAFHGYPGYPNGTNDDTLLGNIAWYVMNSGSTTHAVGGKYANGLGLHDMSGNVLEWCQDWYGPYSSGSGSGSGSGSAVIDPIGPVNPITVGGQEYPHRVTRGGSWGFGSFYVRSSMRDESAHYQTRGDGIGFRVARTPGPASEIWYTELEPLPDPAVVTDANLRAAITATGLPWRIRATPSNIEMVLIPKGTFMMGCSPSTATWWPGCETTGELPKHQVTLTKSFYISRTPVTQAQWQAKMGSNPSFYNNVQQNGFTINTDRPVEMVSWVDVAGAGGFMSQTGFRLPTEAEWEYAYRAGTTTAFHGYPAQPNGFNDDIDGIELRKIAWFSGNIGNCGQVGTSAYGTKAVGLKLANGFGLYDMSGNVFEWCQDWYAPYGGGGGCNQNGCTVTNQAGCLPPCTWTEVSDGTNPCGPNACGPSVQTACCYVAANGDRKCTLGMTNAECTTLNGFFETGVISCSNCDPFLGRCCKTNGECISDITKAACLLQFGTWTQSGTCTPNTCVPTNPIGICCTNGECSTTTESACTGTWIETTDNCSSACACCPCTTGTTIPQRCCTTDASGIVTCASKTVIDCLNDGGAPSGIGTNCSTSGGGGSTSVTNPTGPATGTLRLLRGGDWLYNSSYCRASKRHNHTPDNGGGYVGFRVARTAGSVSDLWYTVLEQNVNAAVVTNVTMRNAITASGLPWRIRDNSSNIEMLLVPGGTFTMGCSPGDADCLADESPAHQVTLTQAFYMGRYEVTQDQWTAKMGSNPSYFQPQNGYTSQTGIRPVENVSWNMIAGAGGFMSATGLRLPTEAEWEYAYRAGTTTAFHSYPAQPNGFSDYTLVGNIAWYSSNSSSQTHAVGGKFANGLGLHDMSGNVLEYCQDWYGPYSSQSGTSCDDPIQCCTPSSCTGTSMTAMQCKAQVGVPSSGLPCCVDCCYDQDTSTPKCEKVYSTALCDAGKRCTDQLGGRVITAPDTCNSCVQFKWKCQADGTCIRSSDGTYTSEQDCLSNCVLGGCCDLGSVCRNSVKADCVFGNWGALCEIPPQLCPDDVIIIVDPCEGLPPSTTTAYCKGAKKTIDCPDCCAEVGGFEECLTECARNGACGPGKGASQEFPSFSGRDNIVPEAACQIDVRIPRACCYIEYDPTFGPVGMTCDNVCSSAECEKLKTVSNSKHPAVYSGGAICPSRRLASSGPTLDCDSSIHLSLTNRSFYAGIPFGTCWTLGLTAQYSCDVSDESACGVVNGYWVSLETSEGQMCDSTYRPQPINISTQRIIEPETMNDSEFQSLGLEFGDFYKGGYYIGTYSPGAPITQFGSSLYGSLNLTAPITSPSTAYGNGENVVTKWALIVEPYTYRTSFLNETEPRILLPHSKLSKYDGFYNCYGNAGFGGLRSSLTNSVLGRNRRGFPDYYLPSIQELMFFAFQINDFSTDNYIKYISIFKNDLLNNMPTYLSSTSIGDTSLYSQYLQPVDRYTFGNISTSTLTSVNTVKFFRRINLT